MGAVQDLERLLAAHGLSGRSEQLIRLSRPAVRITSRLVEADLPVGVSKFGGSPDLPPEAEWPCRKGYPLFLMAQFYLPDVVPYDDEGALPRTGMLYFFYDM